VLGSLLFSSFAFLYEYTLLDYYNIFRILHLQACLVEQEEKERTTDLLPTTSHPIPIPPTTDDLREEIQVSNPVDEIAPITQSTVQKTAQVIRRTVFQNGREISVEEQVQPNEPAAPISEQASKRRAVRPTQVPSPFGVVEEPTYPEEYEAQQAKESSSVEITDVTDHYIGIQSATDEAVGGTPPVTDQIMEIHEVIEVVQVVEEKPLGSNDIVEVSHDPVADDHPIQRQPSQLFETLHENEEDEMDHKEEDPTLLNILEEKVTIQVAYQEPQLSSSEIQMLPRDEQIQDDKKTLSRASSTSSDSSVSTGITIIEPEGIHQDAAQTMLEDTTVINNQEADLEAAKPIYTDTQQMDDKTTSNEGPSEVAKIVITTTSLGQELSATSNLPEEEFCQAEQITETASPATNESPSDVIHVLMTTTSPEQEQSISSNLPDEKLGPANQDTEVLSPTTQEPIIENTEIKFVPESVELEEDQVQTTPIESSSIDTLANDNQILTEEGRRFVLDDIIPSSLVSEEMSTKTQTPSTSSEEDSDSSSSHKDYGDQKEDLTPVVELAEKLIETLPNIIDQLTDMDNALVNEGAEEQLSQLKEEELTKERDDARGTLIEHRASVAPTLGDNTPGPPVNDDDGLVLEELEAQIISEQVAETAEEEELKVQWQEIQELLADRLDQLRQGASSSTHTSSVRYLATVTQVTVNESVEERVVKLNDNLEALKTAVQRKEVVVIQRIVITIVRTVTEWLETIEYRVCTIKQTTSMDRRIEQIHSLSEEVRVVEETLHTLEEVTEMAVEVVNEETKFLLHKCVKSLQEQVKSVREVTKRSEGEMAEIRERWDDFLNQIATEEDRIKDIIQQFHDLQNGEDISIQDKLLTLENIETILEERKLAVTELLHSGQELIKQAPFYQLPETLFDLLNSIQVLEDFVKKERERLVHQAALTTEYQQTLEEFAEIVNLSEALFESKLAASSPEEAELELEKRQRFLFCLSHFLEVLDALEAHLDPVSRRQELHSSLAAQASTILDRATSRQEKDHMILASWRNLEQSWLQEDNWFNELQLQLPDISNVSIEGLPFLEESFKVLLKLEKRFL